MILKYLFSFFILFSTSRGLWFLETEVQRLDCSFVLECFNKQILE